MTGSIIIGNETSPISVSEWDASNSYRCHIAIMKDDKDLYSAIVLNLPGVGSSGCTEDEAVEHAKDAVRGTALCYKEDCTDIPWLMPNEYESDIPKDCHLKWILIDA